MCNIHIVELSHVKKTLPLPKKSETPNDLCKSPLFGFCNNSDSLLAKEDPTEIFVDLQAIGEGYKGGPFNTSFFSSFGAVYSALDTRTLDKVAIKVMGLNGNIFEAYTHF